MLDLLLLAVYLLFFIIGLKKPFVAFMGYTWVDLVVPQNVSYGFLSGRPLSLMIAWACFISLAINFKQLKLPNSFSLIFLMILFFIWITFNTIFFALFPEIAWIRWRLAYKAILVCILIPLTISKLTQLEAYLLTWIFSVSYHILSAGIKTILSGGGYGTRFVHGGSALSESSILSTMAVVLIPFIIYFNKSSILFKNFRIIKYFWVLLGVCCISTVIGSYARTGLVALLVYIVLLILQTKRKILYTLLIAISIAVGFQLVPEDWKGRMNTIRNAESNRSAMGRLVVWKWTLDFIREYPFGGGFRSYLANEGMLITSDEKTSFSGHKAYHNIFFQVLGNHGYVGLAIYVLALFLTYSKLKYIKKHSLQIPINGEWIHSCAHCSIIALIILHVSGMFINIAYQPYALYLSITIVLSLEKIFYSEFNVVQKKNRVDQ